MGVVHALQADIGVLHRIIPDAQEEFGLFGRKVTQALFREVELSRLRETVALPAEEQ